MGHYGYGGHFSLSSRGRRQAPTCIGTKNFASSYSRHRSGCDCRNPIRQIRSGDLVVDTDGYTANLHGKPIDLAYKEFELLKYLVQHPGRVFTRAQLLQEVWGYDYYGGTRTVDVHVRRLRAKLGSEYEQLIGTVRNVGYRFDPPHASQVGSDDDGNGHNAVGNSAEERRGGHSDSADGHHDAHKTLPTAHSHKSQPHTTQFQRHNTPRD
ncbi:transcriptional regulatory protein GlnR [Bifidobacterium tsurumiense]|uniref:Transcriptional regulatory protein GlnR n=1 Tax=Bifidobacterium tsurumiense TaxID=356829 RepID=A0A087EHY7_9BIFI|nr:transcriptional regulatory protein GlnR [Bifidobacterium tsurumiense]